MSMRVKSPRFPGRHDAVNWTVRFKSLGRAISLIDDTSGLSTLNHHRLPGGASRLAALLIAHLCPTSSLFAPGDPGAALRQPVLIQRGQATRIDICIRVVKLHLARR